jgi:hypothetical protein
VLTKSSENCAPTPCGGCQHRCDHSPPTQGAGLTSRGHVSLSDPECARHVRPVLIEPSHRFRPVHGALKRRESGVFERLQRKPVGRVVDEFMQALVAGALFERVCPLVEIEITGMTAEAFNPRPDARIMLILRPAGAQASLSRVQVQRRNAARQTPRC